jgi:hypothetical protein
LSKGKIALAALAVGILGFVAFGLFAWPVDDASFAARGWKADPDAALAAAKASGKPVFLKLGAHY